MAGPIWPRSGKNDVYLNFIHGLLDIGRSCQNSVNSSEKLHIEGYMMGHIVDLWNHVVTKYGRSNMADKWQKQYFLKS